MRKFCSLFKEGSYPGIRREACFDSISVLKSDSDDDFINLLCGSGKQCFPDVALMTDAPIVLESFSISQLLVGHSCLKITTSSEQFT